MSFQLNESSVLVSPANEYTFGVSPVELYVPKGVRSHSLRIRVIRMDAQKKKFDMVIKSAGMEIFIILRVTHP